MRQVVVLLAIVTAGLVMGLASAAQGVPAEEEGSGLSQLRVDEDPQGNPYVVGELIVTYGARASAAAEEEAVREVGAEVDREFSEIDAEVLSIPEVKSKRASETREEALQRKKQELEDQPSVESVSYNYLAEARAVPNDPRFPSQWGLRKIDAPRSWRNAKGTGSVIAVLDTGIYNSHPDIGESKIVDEFDYVDNDPAAQDDNGHGTHVAGIAAAATSNSTGVAGVSPDSRLFDYKVLGADGSGAFDGIIAAIIDATDSGADVINLSLGAIVDLEPLEDAVDYAWDNGVVVVAAAGNESETGNLPNYPAAYSNAIAVGAVNFGGARSNFSNTGGYVDVVAPGGSTALGDPSSENILSTVPFRVDRSGYGFFAGTSMATPHVAGLAANLDSMGYAAARIRQRMETTAADLGPPGRDEEYGRGLIDARAAVRDDKPPRGTILINGGAARTRIRAVRLALRAFDPVPRTGVASMRFSGNGRTWTSWRPYAARETWRLNGGAGIRAVHVQYRDRAGNVSDAARDTIRYAPARKKRSN